MKVVLAIDGSTGSADVVDEVIYRQWPEGTQFSALSVVDMGKWGDLPVIIDDAKHAADFAVDLATSRLIENGLSATKEVIIGFPKKEITEFAAQWGATLIMMGSRGSGGLARLLLGSTVLTVLRSASCSVDIIRRKSGRKPEEMKILVGTDGSDCSVKAAHFLAARPWPAKTQFRVVSAEQLLTVENAVTASPSACFYPESLLNELLVDAHKRAQSAVTECRKILREAGLRVVDGQDVPPGDARSILLDEAASWQATMIVVGSHGKHAFDRMLLGSVSESVALHAHCSVEVVR